MGEIAGYEVRYGQVPFLEDMLHSEQVTDGQAMSVTLDGLDGGTWYFSIRTLDTQGQYGPWSELVSTELL
ncbi:fibronectin type III domain-containing protein [Marinobacter sp. CA1]|nr:fibronectin type III domain-containing protein [Marinobacter sp. CA1]